VPLASNDSLANQSGSRTVRGRVIGPDLDGTTYTARNFGNRLVSHHQRYQTSNNAAPNHVTLRLSR
jgi:hypothetical protein